MFNNSKDLLDPPRHDMIIVKFHGDDFEVTLPYCEVANGQFKVIDSDSIHIAVIKENKTESVAMTYSSFKDVVEKTFDIKEIVALSIQPAGSYNVFKIL
jgi:hypothetical protein